MNVRFAETSRSDHLKLNVIEERVELRSILDGRSQNECRLNCDQDIYIGVFFDGTNNNKYRDTLSFSQSNVARLYEVFPGMPATQTTPTFEKRKTFPDSAFLPGTIPTAQSHYYRKIYVPGVGTPMPDIGDTGKGFWHKTRGLAFAFLGQARLNWALLQLCVQVEAVVTRSTNPPKIGQIDEDEIDSQLSAQVQQLKLALNNRGNNKPKLRKIRLSIFGFSRGAAKARAWVNLVEKRWGGGIGLAGLPVQIDFLGVFDTVASVGIAQSVPGADGHAEWAEGSSLMVPSSVGRCVHLVAAHEVRGSFPLDSVCQGDHLPPNCKEIVYPGVHSDVGGGYPPEEQGRALGQGKIGDQRKISQIPLAQMYREARMAGVPLAPESAMITKNKESFGIDPQLRKDFNAYIEATRSFIVVPTNGRGEAQFARMYPTETQPRERILSVMRRHHAYLLQWRKSMLSMPKGAAGLTGLLQSGGNAKYQDIEDIRGAEEELRKEIAFVQNADVKKFEVFDDVGLEKAVMLAGAASGVVGTLISVPGAGIVGGMTARSEALRRIFSAMQEKQAQWNDWLKSDWAGEGALKHGKVEAANRLFEHYVHDSRAWFKPGYASEPEGIAPDDEDWFVLGGRDKVRAIRIQRLNQDMEKHKKANNKKGIEECQKAIQQLQQEGHPLIVGGREPYRMWGYVRHRCVYQSGKLMDARHTSRQTQIDREEQERNEQVRRERLIAEERAEHESNKDRIKKKNQEVQNNPDLTSREKDEYLVGARSQHQREMERHAKRMRELQAKNTMTVD